MFTPFDTAHLTHRAARHVPADHVTREANRQNRKARRAALHALVLRIRGYLGRRRPVIAVLRTRA